MTNRAKLEQRFASKAEAGLVDVKFSIDKPASSDCVFGEVMALYEAVKSGKAVDLVFCDAKGERREIVRI